MEKFWNGTRGTAGDDLIKDWNQIRSDEPDLCVICDALDETVANWYDAHKWRHAANEYMKRSILVSG